MKNFVLFIAFILSTCVVLAQRGPELGAGIGIANYFGDLNPNFDFTHPGPAGYILARFNFNTRVCIAGSLNYGLVRYKDSYSENAFQKERNLSFRSNIFDLSLVGEFNFLPYVHGSKDNFFTPYLMAGFSAFHYNPKAELDGKSYALQPLGTEGQEKGEEYRLWKGAFTFGMGFKYSLNDYWGLSFEISARKAFTDYLDDVSGTYADKEIIRSDRGEVAAALSDRSTTPNNPFGIGIPGRQRGNSRDKDTYTFITFGVSYYFATLKCPDLSRPY